MSISFSLWPPAWLAILNGSEAVVELTVIFMALDDVVVNERLRRWEMAVIRALAAGKTPNEAGKLKGCEGVSLSTFALRKA
jgi:hypothetical protein